MHQVRRRSWRLKGAEQTLHAGLGDSWTRWDPRPTPWRAGLFPDPLHAVGRADGQGALSSPCSPSPVRTGGAPWGPTRSPACRLWPPIPPRLMAGGEQEAANLVDVTRAPSAPAALFDHTSFTSLLNS